MSRKFQRKKEDFTCEHCGFEIKGTGYTNHCPNCLWSKHVDINPGDREAICQGMMEPIGLESKSSKQIIVHRCTQCHARKRIKAALNDNFEVLLQLSTKPLLRSKN